jgi:hypothetical protein
MKKQHLVLAALLIPAALTAQEQQPGLTYNKKQLDSLFGLAQKFNLPFVNPVPKTFNLTQPQHFEELYPGATVINKTNRGIIYSMPLDKMAVLVPAMNQLERMPGSSQDFKIGPRDNMPNPLYPGRKK